jgi:hypothetical protein
MHPSIRSVSKLLLFSPLAVPCSKQCFRCQWLQRWLLPRNRHVDLHNSILLPAGHEYHRAIRILAGLDLQITVILNGTDNTVGTARTYTLMVKQQRNPERDSILTFSSGAHVVETVIVYSKPPNGPYDEVHVLAPLTIQR